MVTYEDSHNDNSDVSVTEVFWHVTGLRNNGMYVILLTKRNKELKLGTRRNYTKASVW